MKYNVNNRRVSALKRRSADVKIWEKRLETNEDPDKVAFLEKKIAIAKSDVENLKKKFDGQEVDLW